MLQKALLLLVQSIPEHILYRGGERESWGWVGFGVGRRDGGLGWGLSWEEQGMEGGLAMLRQLIGQVEELFELYGSPPNYFLRFPPPPPPPPPSYHRHHHRSFAIFLFNCVSMCSHVVINY